MTRPEAHRLNIRLDYSLEFNTIIEWDRGFFPTFRDLNYPKQEAGSNPALRTLYPLEIHSIQLSKGDELLKDQIQVCCVIVS